VRRTESEWRAILDRYARSGLSESAFCRRAKLSRGSFVKWKQKLAAKTRAATVVEPTFVEWVAPETGSEESLERAGEFELSLPGGVVLRWKA
jgi:hypothetical protein